MSQIVQLVAGDGALLLFGLVGLAATTIAIMRDVR